MERAAFNQRQEYRGAGSQTMMGSSIQQKATVGLLNGKRFGTFAGGKIGLLYAGVSDSGASTAHGHWMIAIGHVPPPRWRISACLPASFYLWGRPGAHIVSPWCPYGGRLSDLF